MQSTGSERELASAVSGLMSCFGGNVRRERMRQHLTQAQLARRAGVVHRTVQRVDAATTNATLDCIERFARALGTTPASLLRKVTIDEDVPPRRRGRPSGSARPMPRGKPLTYDVGLREALAENVARWRRDRGLILVELHRRSGCHWRHIQRIELGQDNVTLATIARLAVGLGVEPQDLVSHGMNREPKEEPRGLLVVL